MESVDTEDCGKYWTIVNDARWSTRDGANKTEVEQEKWNNVREKCVKLCANYQFFESHVLLFGDNKKK